MVTIRQIRLVTGFALFTYVTLHLTVLATGLAGLETLTALGDFTQKIWGNPVGLVLLYGSLAVHMGLAFQSLYNRRSLRMPFMDALQLVLGLSIPVLLAIHVVSNRGGALLYEIDTNYRVLQTIFWDGGTESALQQVAGLLVAWVHGSIGVYYWLRLKPFFKRWSSVLAAAAAVVPVAALAGFVTSGREVLLRVQNDPTWSETSLAPLAVATVAERDRLGDIEVQFVMFFFVAILVTLAARLLRDWQETRRGTFRLRYSDFGNKEAVAPIGLSILEVSRNKGIPHASVCGGRGRCSTCRVRINGAEGALDDPREEEARVLERIKAAKDVRLACQTRPKGDLNVKILLPPNVGPSAAYSSYNFREGEERIVAILFADLRGFTTLSETKLPYDVVFLLNRFAREMGAAIEQHGGRIDKFMGDGVMALFGLEHDPALGARQALAAAREMQSRLQHINASMADDLPEPLQMGIGIHTGSVIVGEIGHGKASSITAIGDVVNTSSRLESLTKEFGAKLVVSEAFLEQAGEKLPSAELHEVAVKGRREPMRIFVAREL